MLVRISFYSHCKVAFCILHIFFVECRFLLSYPVLSSLALSPNFSQFLFYTPLASRRFFLTILIRHHRTRRGAVRAQEAAQIPALLSRCACSSIVMPKLALRWGICLLPLSLCNIQLGESCNTLVGAVKSFWKTELTFRWLVHTELKADLAVLNSTSSVSTGLRLPGKTTAIAFLISVPVLLTLVSPGCRKGPV